MRSDRCPRSNQAMITLSCVILPFLILGQGASGQTKGAAKTQGTTGSPSVAVSTLPKTKQEIQKVWDETVDKITKKYKVDKRTAGNAIEVVEYLADFMDVIKVLKDTAGIEIQQDPNSSPNLNSSPNPNDDLACRKYGAELLGVINKVLKKGILAEYKFEENSSLGELENDPGILQRHIDSILDEQGGKMELVAIKIFLNASIKNLEKKAVENNKIATENERLAVIKRKEDARLALMKQNQDEENARAAMARQKLEDQQKMIVRNKEIAEIPDRIRKLEDLIKQNNIKLKENKESSEKAGKDIRSSENAIALDMKRLPNVPLALQKTVIDRIYTAKEKIGDFNRSIDTLKNEDKFLMKDIEKKEMTIEKLMITKKDDEEKKDKSK